jgi:hypothetical protein
MSFFSFVRSVLSEDGVTGSYSRCASTFIVFFTVVWITFLVFKHGTMPDLGGALAFLTAGVGVNMGINKAGEVVAAVKGDNPPNPPKQ